MAQFFSSVPEKVPIIQSAFLTWSRFYESFVTLTSAYHQISDQSLGSSKTCWNISEDVLLCLHELLIYIYICICICIYLRANTGRSLAVQWLRLHLDCRVLIFRQGAKIPYASWPKHQKHKTEEYCNIFNKDFKNGPREKKKKVNVSLHLDSQKSSLRWMDI